MDYQTTTNQTQTSLMMNDIDENNEYNNNGVGASSSSVLVPELRRWDLNESSSTRFDRLVAAPTDYELKIMWLIWGIVAIICSVYITVICLGILLNRETRKSSFNVYLLFLMFPDWCMALLCGIVDFRNFRHGGFTSMTLCNFEAWYLVWTCASNAWLNAVIAHEIYQLLLCSEIRKRYFPPTRSMVAIKSLGVYVYAGVLGMLPFMNDIFPHKVRIAFGAACAPLEYDTTSSLFFWLIFFPLYQGLPLLYVMYIVYFVVRKKLLPLKGRRRTLGI